MERWIGKGEVDILDQRWTHKGIHRQTRPEEIWTRKGGDGHIQESWTYKDRDGQIMEEMQTLSWRMIC